MVPRRRRISFVFVPAAAVTGVVLGHALAYLASFPQAASRQEILAETGHSYWATAEAMAIVCAVLSAVSTLVRHVRRGTRHERSRSTWQRYMHGTLQLGAIQCAVFVVQELLERLHAGAPLSGLLHDGFIAIGIAMQILVAAVLALILTALALTGEAIGHALSRSRFPRRSTRRLLGPNSAFVRWELAAQTDRTRAPPATI
jgi:hypothetical protein